MFKFDSRVFYKRHNNEVNKYIFPELNNLHILSENSSIQDSNDNCKYLYIEKIESLYKELENLTTLYDLIIITDLLEEVNDMNKFFQIMKLKELLNYYQMLSLNIIFLNQNISNL